MAITRVKTSSVAQGPSTKKTLLGGNDVILGGSYDAIGTVVVGAGGSSSISFTSIPSTYKHLQIRALYKVNNTNSGSSRITYNGDSGNNYSSHYLIGDGSSASAGAVTSSPFAWVGVGEQSTSNFSVSVLDVLDYANVSKNKTHRALSGVDNNGSGVIVLTSGAWLNTSAINSITLTPQSNTTPTNTYLQYSQFDLYGIK
jgi:hypothetical protein